MGKKFWKCKVCSDIHYGDGPPIDCPSCETKNAYFEITKEEAKESMDM